MKRATVQGVIQTMNSYVMYMSSAWDKGRRTTRNTAAATNKTQKTTKHMIAQTHTPANHSRLEMNNSCVLTETALVMPRAAMPTGRANRLTAGRSSRAALPAPNALHEGTLLKQSALGYLTVAAKKKILDSKHHYLGNVLFSVGREGVDIPLYREYRVNNYFFFTFDA